MVLRNYALRRRASDFGKERVTRGSHLEKLCLIQEGVGRDNISDFTTNLIREHLLNYTQRFAKRRISAELRRAVTVAKVRFNYETETWEHDTFDLPWRDGEYILRTPRDMLTKDDTWINRTDLVEGFDRIPEGIPNAELRAQVNNYFLRMLPRNVTEKDKNRAAAETILHFPQIIDFYIKSLLSQLDLESE